MSDPVSRETDGHDPSTSTPSTPDVAGRVFSSARLPLAERYAELLATEGVTRGLIGPREAPRLWERHLLNSAVLAEAVPEGSSVVDLGTGAGLPGVALAIARPDLEVTLVEPLLRRTTFLLEVVVELQLREVTVVRGRAEELHGERRFDVVTSRAVAPLDRLLDWSMPLVEGSGALVAMKGRNVAEEIAASQKVLRRWMCAAPEVLSLGQGIVDPVTTAVRVTWQDPARPGPVAPRTGGKRHRGGARQRTSRGAQT